MEGLLTFLLFAGLFFIMMRFGCGAHMKHGHGKGHGQSRHDTDQQKYIDPVCGMEVDSDKGYGKMHEGVLFRFCSKDCLDKFDTNPGLYLSTHQTHDEHHHAGGAK
ncbi:MAG TPA: YHS domain-containing protein [Chromatiales bacterium]|nr:YHS domain-containing protein [Thiotrichales bacterium]HIP69025.1 YHS domain-containing protein [Chromatiales bacterium]